MRNTKKQYIINENFPDKINEDPTEFLLNQALLKQKELQSLFVTCNEDITPLVIVQLQGAKDYWEKMVKKCLVELGITLESGKLAIMTGFTKENVDGVWENNAKTAVLIIDQSINNWSCPRAYILVKLHESISKPYDSQIIKRISSMPNEKYYADERLNNGYVYSLDNCFKEYAELLTKEI